MQILTFSIFALYAYATTIQQLPAKENATRICVFSDAHLSTFTTDYLTAGSDVAFDSFWKAINNIRRQNCDAEIFLGGAVRQNGTAKEKGYDHEKFWLSMCPSRNGRIAIPCIAKSDVSELYTEQKIRELWKFRMCSAGTLYNNPSPGIGHFTQKVGNLTVHVLNTIPFDRDTPGSDCNDANTRAGKELAKLRATLKPKEIIVGHLPPYIGRSGAGWSESCILAYAELLGERPPLLQVFGHAKMQLVKDLVGNAAAKFHVNGGLMINKDGRSPVFESYDIEGNSVKGYTHSMQVDNHMMTGNSFITPMQVS